MIISQIKRGKDEFQQTVDQEALRQKLSRELPEEKITKVTELNAGLFNNTYRVHAEAKNYILKIAPGENADVFYNERFLMQREKTLSAKLQSLSPLIPEYLSFFKIGGRGAFLQRFIEGQLWHDKESSLSELENAELWKQLGAFAKILHSCEGEQFGYPAPFQSFGRWSEFITDNVNGMVEDCHRLGVYCEEIETYCRFLPQFSSLLDQVQTPRLCHGDLWPRNVLFEGAGEEIRLKSVFDAERAFWGDPISDWVLILYGLPQDFWEGYGENLLETGNPARVTVYKGMYFILNILETTRFEKSREEPRKWLSGINEELSKLSSR